MPKIEYFQYVHRTLRLRVGKPFYFDPGCKANVYYVRLQPAPGYEPPTENDRWGWRSHLEDRWGEIAVYAVDRDGTERQNPLRFDALTLMDAYWRLSIARVKTPLGECEQTLNYVVKRCRDNDDEATCVLTGAIRAARWEYNAWASGAERTGCVGTAPFGIYEDCGIVAHEEIGGRRDFDADMAIEVGMIEIRPLSAANKRGGVEE